MTRIQLQLAVEQAMEALAQQIDHSLKPIYRCNVYAAFGPVQDINAYRTRGWLDVLTANHVLPIWQGVWPDDNTPADLLLLAEGLLGGTVSREEAHKKWNVVWARLQGRNEEGKWQAHEEACCARQAAIQAVSWLINPDLTCAEVTESDTDEDLLDPVCSDSALWAAAAYSGAMWSVEPNLSRNQEFWIWWLEKAIPRAIELV